MRMRHIVVCGLPDSTLIFYIFSIEGKIFEKNIYGT
jgi:hypothetical protein